VSRMGEEAMAKVSGWREDWNRERRTEVRVRRLFSSWRGVVSKVEGLGRFFEEGGDLRE
jgi:hypothetical protein